MTLDEIREWIDDDARLVNKGERPWNDGYIYEVDGTHDDYTEMLKEVFARARTPIEFSQWLQALVDHRKQLDQLSDRANTAVQNTAVQSSGASGPSGAAIGAGVGSVFGPLGSVVGGLAGGLLDWIF